MESSCTISRATLGRFRDAELEAAEEAALAAHVSSCGRCQGYLADLELIGDLFSARREAVALPAGFSERVLAALPPSSAGVPAAPGVLERWAAVIAAHRDAFALALFGVGVAAALLVVFTPGLRSDGSAGSSQDRIQEAAENEAQIHSLEVTDQNAVVLRSAEGNTVIWAVSPSPEESSDGSPQKTPAP